MLHFVILLRCPEVRLEVCPGFSVALPVVPFVSVVIKQARVVHYRVYGVDDIFVGDRLSSIVHELLYFLDTLH